MALEASIRIIFDRRKKASATVKGCVEIEVYYNRQRVRFSTGVNVLKQQWRGGQVVNHSEETKMNEQIINRGTVNRAINSGIENINTKIGTGEVIIDGIDIINSQNENR